MSVKDIDISETKDVEDDISKAENLKMEDFLKEKHKMECEFGKKRAKFKEIYLQKEEEYNQLQEDMKNLKEEKCLIQTDFENIQKELNECKSLLTIAEYTKENEIEAERRRCQEEVASLQKIMEESLNETKLRAAAAHEKEILNLKSMNNRMEAQRNENRHSSFIEKEGVLSAVTKSLKRSVGGLSANLDSACQTDSIENLEESMYKAQQDAEMLRSLVVPLEKEINSLKEEICRKDDELKSIKQRGLSVSDTCKDANEVPQRRKSTNTLNDLDEKMTNLSLDLEAEKSSRSDLEMYVGVLSAQKSVLHNENDKIQKELVEVCKMLENEKRDHIGLKQTWQRANDQFLEAQRVQIIEMRRMQSVLSEEQQRQILQLKKQEEVENKLKNDRLPTSSSGMDNSRNQNITKKSTFKRSKSSRSYRKTKVSPDNVTNQLLSVDNISMTSDKALSDSNIALRMSTSSPSTPIAEVMKRVQAEDQSVGIRRAYSSSAVSLLKGNSDPELAATSNLSQCEASAETQSLHEVDSFEVSFKNTSFSPDRITALTEAQKEALTGVTRESEAREAMLESVRSNLSGIEDILPVPVSGKRLVSEMEWHLLQEELKKATEKLSRPCDMCNNYETQLQNVQHELKEKEQQNKTFQQMLDRYKDDFKKEQSYRQDLESKLSSLAEQSQKEVKDVYLKLEESVKSFTDLKSLYASCYADIRSQFGNLVREREEIQKELTKLQMENDSLTAKYSAQAQEMQNEVINLPNNLEDMQLLLLKYHEEIIAAKVSKQHTEETLRSELMFLRDQVKAEQTAKDRIEDQLMQELDALRQNTGITESIRSELEREKALRIEYEKSLKDSHVQIKQTQDKSRHTISTLQKKYEDTVMLRDKFKSDVDHLKNKVQSLQTDLENNEAVQRDFVKLSQNLQVELEKIRQSEKEVRWQHEDDVDDCSNCKQNFTVTRRKHHCRHCGKIFCADCLAKIVYSGPHKRQSKVCDVCHTLLVPDIAPYFSNEPPHTPD